MDDLIKEIDSFRKERNWNELNNPKDLSIALEVEASELLEIFMWKSSDLAMKNSEDRIKEELADVFIYALTLSSELNLKPSEIIRQKLKINNEKYPLN